MNQFYLVSDWYNASYNTPDYIHTNAPGSNNPVSCGFNSVKSNDNWLGVQMPRTGNAYAAIHLYVSSQPAREYIGVELTERMCVGQEYNVELFVSAGDYSEFFSNIGVLFSVDKVTESWEIETEPSLYIPYPVQERNTWVQFKSVFKADKPYKYLTLGNFFNYNDPRCILDGPYTADPPPYLSSYYIDDVSVIPVPNTKPELGSNIRLCTNEKALLSANVNANAYLWSTRDTTPFISVSTGGAYSVCVQYCHSTLCDTIEVDTLAIPALYLGNDTTVCSDSIAVKLTIDKSYSVVWSNGSTSHEITATDFGRYIAYVSSDNGCSNNDTLDIASNCPDCFSSAIIYPNPVVGSAYISLTSEQDYDAVLRVYSISGQIVVEDIIFIKQGANNLILDYNKLLSGTYFAEVLTGCGKVIIPFVAFSD